MNPPKNELQPDAPDKKCTCRVLRAHEAIATVTLAHSGQDTLSAPSLPEMRKPLLRAASIARSLDFPADIKMPVLHGALSHTT